MRPDFWLERWHRGHIAFHQRSASRYLQQHWQTLGIHSAASVFVPLCGKSLDLLWLRNCGHAVLGVELSSIALESFCTENGILARRQIEKDFEIYEARQLKLLRGDFFALSAAKLGKVSAVYDRAALISWSAELRESYAQHMASLTAFGTNTLLLTLEYPQYQTDGPPFSVPAAEVQKLYGECHSIQELSRKDVLADEPRMRARGVTQLQEVCYRLIRLDDESVT